MGKAKIAITLDEEFISELDSWSANIFFKIAARQYRMP